MEQKKKNTASINQAKARNGMVPQYWRRSSARCQIPLGTYQIVGQYKLAAARLFEEASQPRPRGPKSESSASKIFRHSGMTLVFKYHV